MSAITDLVVYYREAPKPIYPWLKEVHLEKPRGTGSVLAGFLNTDPSLSPNPLLNRKRPVTTPSFRRKTLSASLLITQRRAAMAQHESKASWERHVAALGKKRSNAGGLLPPPCVRQYYLFHTPHSPCGAQQSP